MDWHWFPKEKPDEYESVWMYFDELAFVGFCYEGRMHAQEHSFDECWWAKIEPPEDV